MNAFKEEYQEAFEELIGSRTDEEIEPWPKELEGKLRAEQERLSLKYRIPPDLYLTTEEPIRESEFSWWKEALASWSSGTMSPEESAEFVSALDHNQFDEYYILLEVPNFLISGIQRNLLERSLIELGCGFENEWEKLDELCDALRADPTDS
ncbi:MAG: hypothetical protein V4528_00500 [Pseudomonadota bacterium]